MNEANHHPSERLLELLADQALQGLDDAQQAELTTLLENTEDQSLENELDLAIAAAYQVYEHRAGVIHEPMPAALSHQLITEGYLRTSSKDGQATEDDGPVAVIGPSRPPLSHPALGWLTAAAVLAFSTMAWFANSSLRNDVGDFASDRNSLIQTAQDTVTTAWAPSDDPIYGKVTGDIVWSDSEQRGYMRLIGLPINDPSVEQYQLWIVDPDVDSHPVDGGVFNVDAQGEAIIPIDAKLPVDHPTVFAITLEKPGGVVVSAGPLRVVAPVGS